MRRIACAALFLLVLGCRSKLDTSRETEALLNTDREWARVASTGRNADSVVAFWTEDARVMAPNAPPVRGKAAAEALGDTDDNEG